MTKIAIIGAGSQVFTRTLAADIIATPALAASHIALMSPTAGKLERMRNFVQKMIAVNHSPATVSATTDRREALRDADFVIVTLQIGGMAAFKVDYEIPLKYGIDQCVGDSLAPGGIFRGLRTIPVLLDIAADMRELCPQAVMLNYANPMAACCLALGKVPGLRYVGLCHGVQTTLDLIAGYVGVPKAEIDYVCAGINHMAWFLKLRDRRDGRDLYPEFKAKMELPEYYVNEKVRGEVLRHFGYFMTESTGHLSEYLPWFRSHQRARQQYCDQPEFGGESGAAYKYGVMIAEKYRQTDCLEFENPVVERRSIEYCSYIMEALITGTPFCFNGNLRNDGYIANLPEGCCVEVPIYADRNGFHPWKIGALPPQLAAMNRSNVTVQELTAEAAVKGDFELVTAALAMDPLTSAVATLAEIREMAAEMLEASRQWLPQFSGQTPRRVAPVTIPAGTVGVPVPLDPALAVAHRFAQLARQKTEE